MIIQQHLCLLGQRNITICDGFYTFNVQYSNIGTYNLLSIQSEYCLNSWQKCNISMNLILGRLPLYHLQYVDKFFVLRLETFSSSEVVFD